MEALMQASANGLAAPDEETCLGNRAFGGWIRSRLRCPTCWHTKASYEAFLDLSLPITEVTDTLEEARQHFSRATA